MKKLEEIRARAEVNAILGRTASQDEARDTLKLVAALEAALDKLDNYPIPSKTADPTGAVLSGMEGLEGIIRSAIKEAMQ